MWRVCNPAAPERHLRAAGHPWPEPCDDSVLLKLHTTSIPCVDSVPSEKLTGAHRYPGPYHTIILHVDSVLSEKLMGAHRYLGPYHTILLHVDSVPSEKLTDALSKRPISSAKERP